MNELQDKIKECELYLPYLHSEKNEAEWGFMCSDLSNPFYTEANRAVITKSTGIADIANDINKYYSSKNIEPHAVSYNEFYHNICIKKIQRDCLFAPKETAPLLLSRKRADISEENFLEVNGKTLGVLIHHPFSFIRFPQVFKVVWPL